MSEEKVTITLDANALRVFVSKAIYAVKLYDDMFGKNGFPGGEAGSGTEQAGELQAYLYALETLSGMNCAAMAMTVRDVIRRNHSSRDRTTDLCKRLDLMPDSNG